jgi:peptide/nickel transport system permease protein
MQTSTGSATPAPTSNPATPKGRPWLGGALRDRSAIAGATILGCFLVLAVFAPWIEPYSTVEPSCGVFEAPSWTHWMGCDDGGIDVLSLVIRGGRISMMVGVAASIIAIALGGTVGILSGYFGGWVDTVLMRITDYLLVIPQVVLMIVVAAVWGPSLSHVVIVIGVLMWTTTARLVRAQVKSLRERVFVRRVESLGASHGYIILFHILPQLGPLLVASTVLAITVAIFNETALAFLGLSDPSAVTWGTIMEHAFDRAAVSTGAWWAIVPAGLAVAIVTMGCYMLGRSIEDALNPRLRVSYLSPRSWRMRPLVGRGPDAE